MTFFLYIHPCLVCRGVGGGGNLWLSHQIQVFRLFISTLKSNSGSLELKIFFDIGKKKDLP